MGRGAIATQIVVLASVAMLLVSAILLAITFRGPPPMARPVAVDELATVLRGAHDDLPDAHVTRIERAPPRPNGGLLAQLALSALLARRLGEPRALIVAEDQAQGPGAPAGSVLPGFAAAAPVEGGWRVVRVASPPRLTRWHYVTLGALALTLILLIGAAWFVARTIARPVVRLGEAAAATSAGGHGPPLPMGGPREVAQTVAAVAAMRARLSAAIDDRTAMLLGIAHDLGTPLNRLAFRAQGLGEADRSAAQAEIDGMRAMLARVLDYARDGIDAAPGPVDLAAVVAVAAGRAGVPAETVPATLTGDALALERLFANLFDNAAAYGGGAEVTMTLAEGVARIAVTDRGPGIDPALLPRLFEPFVRGEPSRNRATGGTGLGLAIARRIAERHGGTIDARNRTGGGAVFTVVLPVG